MDKIEFKYDTQCLIEGTNLKEDEIDEYIRTHIKGDSLLACGDETLIKIHYHTNEPWEVIAYAASLGDVFDIVIENMQRQSEGKKG